MSVQLMTALLMRSAKIQQKIENEQRRRWPDGIKLIKLKKLRLSIKDRLLRLLNEGRAQSFVPRCDLALKHAPIRRGK